MRYMLLIYSKETDWAALAEKDRGQMFAEYGAFTEGIRKSGHYIGGNPLSDAGKAQIEELAKLGVRVKNE